jgi:DNA primase
MKADRLLEEIKSRIDIVEFISDYVPLKKSGQNYKGLCPFHSEKTPSFMVSQAKQIFHCFGCGVGGDVISFLMKQESLSFGEAMRYLAKKAGVRMTDFQFDKDLSEKREKILRINEEAMKFYMKNLQAAHTAAAYLKKRGINEESLAAFCLGFAPDNRDTLFKYFKKAGHADSLLMKAGLVAEGGRDLFRRRIIFPIFNMKNDVIGFGGRVMDNSLPKYLNSPETEVFKKGETLFAINLAKDEIRKSGYAIIVEGYLDAIMCRQYAFKNAVAPLGTALTSKQLQKLRILTKKVVLIFDGDQAGISAARRSLAILCENNFKAKVILLPEGEDPDSFLRKNGSQPFQKMLSKAVSMVEFLLNSSKGDRIDSVREALGMIAGVKDILMAEEMLGELSDRARTNESVLRSELDKIKRRAGVESFQRPKSGAAPLHEEERLLLSAIISFPEKAGAILTQLSIQDILDKTTGSLLQKIKLRAPDLNIPSLLDSADDTEKALITELSLKPGFDPEHVDKIIEDCLQKLRQRDFEEKRRLAESSGDIALLNSLLKEKRKLIDS